MNYKKHIVFICSSLNYPGGIERAITNIANMLQADGFKISILVLDKMAGTFYPLHSDVQVLHYALHFGITESGNMLTRKRAFFQHVRQLGKIITPLQAHVVIGTEYVFAIAAYLALSNTPVKLYSWEHHHFYFLQKSAFWRFVLKKVYPKLDGIICLNAAEAALCNKFGYKTHIIPNYVKQSSYKVNLNSKTLLTVGWLTKHKGIDLVPAIAKIVFEKHPDWKWKLIGSGEEHEHLKKFMEEKKLTQQIEIIPPETNDLSNYYRNTSVYVLLSRFECLPFVLLEAMSFGVPCVAFNCPTGPAAIIEDKKSGFLIPPADVNALSAAIINLIENAALREKMGAAAFHAVARFSPAYVLELWQQLLGS